MRGAAPNSEAASCTQTSSERGSFAYINAWPEGSASCLVHTGGLLDPSQNGDWIPLRNGDWVPLRNGDWIPLRNGDWIPLRNGDCSGHLNAVPLLARTRGRHFVSSGSALRLPCCLTLVNRCCICALPLSPSRSFLYYFFFLFGVGWKGGGVVLFTAGTISVLLLCLATASRCHFHVLPLQCYRERVFWKGALTSIWVLDFGDCHPGDIPWPPGSGCQGSWYSWVPWACDNQRVLGRLSLLKHYTNRRLKHSLSVREAYWIFDPRSRLQVWYRSG